MKMDFRCSVKSFWKFLIALNVLGIAVQIKGIN